MDPVIRAQRIARAEQDLIDGLNQLLERAGKPTHAASPKRGDDRTYWNIHIARDMVADLLGRGNVTEQEKPDGKEGSIETSAETGPEEAGESRNDQGYAEAEMTNAAERPSLVPPSAGLGRSPKRR